MKRLVVYRSFFGATKRYAELLHEEMESDIAKYNKVDDSTFQKYEMVILCSATYAGWINLSGYLVKHWNVLKERVVILVVIGAAPMDAEWSIRSYNKIPENIRQGIKYYKLPAQVKSGDTDKARKEYLAPVVDYIGKQKGEDKK
ncbi:flavodoxin domain-containing protein [Chloroflexota bacterium]